MPSAAAPVLHCVCATVALLSACNAGRSGGPDAFVLSVQMRGAGSGTVILPAQDSCASDCTRTITAGRIVELRASADADSVFDGWSGVCTGLQGCSVQMNGNLAVTATFSAPQKCPAGARVPGPPRNFQIEGGIRSAFIAWAPPLDDGGCPVREYHVRILQLDHAPREQITKATSLFVDGFENGKPVCFALSAVNAIGQGPVDAPYPGAACTGGVNMPDVPLAPTNAIAFPRSDSAEVLWNPPSRGNMLNQPLHSLYPITSYRVIATPGEIAVTTGTVPIENTDVLYAVVPGLTDGVTYKFTVLAQSDVGDSKPSKPSNPITPPTSIWKKGAMLPFAWYGYATVPWGGYLYVLGAGFSAPMAADGTPGPWKRIESLDWRPWLSGAVFTADAERTYLYAVGGLGHEWEVVSARVLRDGTLTPWAEAGPRLEIPRAAHATAIYKNYLYVIGGTPGYSDISFATLQHNGTYARWTKTTPLPRGAMWVLSFVYKNFLYAIDGEGFQDVLIATLGEDGMIQGGWRRATAQLPMGRNQPGGSIVGSNIYVAGGWTRQPFSPELGTSSVLLGRIDPSGGDVTSWEEREENAFFGPRDQFGFVASGNRLYVMGGNGAIEQGLARLSDVQFANVDPATGHLRP